VPKLVFNCSQCVPRVMFIAHTWTSATESDVYSDLDRHMSTSDDVLIPHQTAGGA